MHYYENVRTYLDNAYKHLIILLFGVRPHHPIFKHGFTCCEQTTNVIDIELNRTLEWDPLGFDNNLLDPSNLVASLPRFDGVAMKLALTLLSLRWIKRGLLQDYPIPNLFSTK